MGKEQDRGLFFSDSDSDAGVSKPKAAVAKSQEIPSGNEGRVNHDSDSSRPVSGTGTDSDDSSETRRILASDADLLEREMQRK